MSSDKSLSTTATATSSSRIDVIEELSSKPNTTTIRKVRFRVCKFEYFEPGLEEEIALENKSELYYQGIDYDRLEAESDESVRRMMKSKFSPAKLEKYLLTRRNLSSRGLEERVPGRGKDQARIRMKAVRLVLALQRIQKEQQKTGNCEGQVVDEEAIAKRYRKLSSSAVMSAHVLGLQDEIFAEWISEGCPEEDEELQREGREPSSSLNNTSEADYRTPEVLVDMQEGRRTKFRHRHYPKHCRTLSPHQLFCGRGLSRLFKQQQLFVAVGSNGAYHERMQIVDRW